VEGHRFYKGVEAQHCGVDLRWKCYAISNASSSHGGIDRLDVVADALSSQQHLVVGHAKKYVRADLLASERGVDLATPAELQAVG
jgi:hypothetical protein